MTYALGIDVGTTYTAAALWRDGRVLPVELTQDGYAIPSVLFLREDGVMLVGGAADIRAVGAPERVAREFKRRLGDDVPLLLGNREVKPQELFGDLIRFVV